MCLLSPICQITDGSCNCSQAYEVAGYFNSYSQKISHQSRLYFESILIRALSENEALLRILQENCLKLFATVNQEMQKISERSIESGQNAELTTSSLLLKNLSGNSPNHSYFLQLTSELPSPAYKARSFCLEAKIVNIKNEQINLNTDVKFILKLYTSDFPPQSINENLNGEKIMRGNIEVEANSLVRFSKIFISEVSSHFRNGSLFLVILPIKCDYIKPLIIEDFVVRARKMFNEEPLKKAKHTEF
jgi:hypothetical protein